MSCQEIFPARDAILKAQILPFHIGGQDGEAVPRLITVAWREASPAGPISTRTTTPKAVELFPFPFLTHVRPLQGRSLFFRISAGGAFCTTQRLAFVGQLRRPSAYVPSRSCDSLDTGKSLEMCVFLRVYPPIWFWADTPVRPYNVLSCRGICDAIMSM